MKIFILGLPESGRSSVATTLCQDSQYGYVDGVSWVKHTFRPNKEGEHAEQYHDLYHHYLIDRLKEDSNLFIRNIQDTISSSKLVKHHVIDGVATPRDFALLFDCQQDFVVFLNRIDSQEIKTKDYEIIGISVMRDYCFWLSSAGLLSRQRWHEYNFKIMGSQDRFKAMGSKNSVFIMGSLDKVIAHLRETLINLPDQES